MRPPHFFSSFQLNWKMKFHVLILPLLSLVATAAAQRAFIEYPPQGATVRKGRRTTVQLVRPNSLQGSQEVGLVLSFLSCPTSPCPPATQQLGSVLYNGRYNPQLHEQPGRPYQNFTVTIPNLDFMATGRAEIISTRFHLIGAGPSPVLETNVVEVNLAV